MENITAGTEAMMNKSSVALKKVTPGSQAGEKTRTHVIRENVICDTESAGRPKLRATGPLGLVVGVGGGGTEGLIPLWGPNVILRWRFQERSLDAFQDPVAARAYIQQLLGEAVGRWGDAAPVQFMENNDVWDFEIVMRRSDQCTSQGCVLASAFFPDSGRHKLVLYPKLFAQTREEQVETLIHEVGHIFGLRHFFALELEKDFPSQIFGKHQRFTIMNYGEDSRLTEVDRSDLKNLYALAWSGKLISIGGTPIQLFRPYHETPREPQLVLPLKIG